MADLTFLRYDVLDSGIEMEFVDFSPGPGLPTNYTIQFSDAELAAITTQLQLRNAVVSKLQRKLLRVGIASKLDQFIGQTVTI